ncbi:hypothetical protein Y1Q_0022955 [Alligator mississippiensis]|uniref:Uncharacterized protein n=1 Tax=Alligator mississippiensis TaxID=8496 RepID=A0A151P732_ALLMI|nr:hypothetical protein Y1Q_0022955 [Alligator mississippiensis]
MGLENKGRGKVGDTSEKHRESKLGEEECSKDLYFKGSITLFLLTSSSCPNTCSQQKKLWERTEETQLIVTNTDQSLTCCVLSSLDT